MDTVLVIDDDPDFRELVRLYIEAEGATVLEAKDCEEGIEVLKHSRDRVGLVLLDYWMPNMDPARCSARIRALVRPSAQIVLVTAAVDPARRASELGLSMWLSKPFDLELLRRKVLELRAQR